MASPGADDLDLQQLYILSRTNETTAVINLDYFLDVNLETFYTFAVRAKTASRHRSAFSETKIIEMETLIP